MLNIFVISFGLLMMSSSLLFLTQSMYLLPLTISFFLSSAYSIWSYGLNVWLEKQIYLIGSKYAGEVTHVKILYGVRYYEVDCEKYKFSIRARKSHHKVGDKVNVWAVGNISFLDGDFCAFSCDGVVAMGCRLIASISWFATGFIICWPMELVSLVLLGWQLYATDIRLSFKRGDEKIERISNVSVLGSRVYLDLESGKRVSTGYAVYEMYPIGASVTYYGSYADTLSVKL